MEEWECSIEEWGVWCWCRRRQIVGVRELRTLLARTRGQTCRTQWWQWHGNEVGRNLIFPTRGFCRHKGVIGIFKKSLSEIMQKNIFQRKNLDSRVQANSQRVKMRTGFKIRRKMWGICHVYESKKKIVHNVSVLDILYCNKYQLKLIQESGK